MNQYREGKVKSTPMRGVKQFLKPDAYKQSEPSLSINLWWTRIYVRSNTQRKRKIDLVAG